MVSELVPFFMVAYPFPSAPTEAWLVDVQPKGDAAFILFPHLKMIPRVLDGDTIEVLHNGKAQRIRLQGIDCPEKGQAFRSNAKQATSALIFAQEVTLQIHGKDKYGRVLADVLLTDGTNVNQELVKEGWCRWYQKYAPDNTTLENLETEAREARKGLWIDQDPIPPWDFRKAKRNRDRDR